MLIVTATIVWIMKVVKIGAVSMIRKISFLSACAANAMEVIPNTLSNLRRRLKKLKRVFKSTKNV